MKTGLYLLALGTGLVAIVSSVNGQSPPTIAHSAAISPAMFTAALKAAPPAKNLVTVAQGKGEVVAFSSQGFVLESDGVFLPRITLTNLSEKDFRALLESKTVYDSLTAFNFGRTRTASSGIFEARLRDIWSKGDSLSDKIRARIAILEAMRGYNDSLVSYAGSRGFASDAIAINQSALGVEQTDVVVVSNAVTKVDSTRDARANGDAPRRAVHEAYHDLRQANSELDNTVVRANGAANLATAMQQNAQIFRNNCEIYAGRLAGFGIKVSGEPPFEPVPSLSMRFEVDVDRLSK